MSTCITDSTAIAPCRFFSKVNIAINVNGPFFLNISNYSSKLFPNWSFFEPNNDLFTKIFILFFRISLFLSIVPKNLLIYFKN